KISGIAVFLQSSGGPVNNPPVVTKPANVTLNSGQSWTYQVQASDPDAGAVLTYSASNLPASLSINANTGLITGTVTAATGTYTVNLTVKDQQNLSATTSFVITVGSAP
ncbi:cadherin repeat domain-containing protein, partial [Flavihumibacter sp. R14]|nr:cadherin repeat domain-containing protein [Flavihumibacter soli]NEU06738.1 cadherin repeat domain-containing protein [Flavihumibacter soli]